jgi:hypothetical protein
VQLFLLTPPFTRRPLCLKVDDVGFITQARPLFFALARCITVLTFPFPAFSQY